jgi:hypothetical protein
MLSLFKKQSGQEDQKEQDLTEFKDPFNSDCCEKIIIWIQKPILFFEKGIEYTSVINFKNGNTSGQQRVEAEDFPSLLKKIEEFVKALENK